MEKVKLGDYVKQIRGVSYKPTDLHNELNSDSVILLRANNINDGKINFDDIVYIDKSKVKEEQYLKRGDILVCASSGSKELVGKSAFINKDYDVTFGAFCKLIRPKDCIAEYLGHYFNSQIYKEKISSLALGANINNIRNEHINELIVYLPNKAEQQNISILLDEVVDIIDKRKKQLEKLDELVKSRFIEMFGDPLIEDDRYPRMPLGSLAEVGSSKRIFEKEYVSEGIPFYRTKEIVELSKDNRITTELFITKERYDEIRSEYGVPQKGDLLISAVGTIGVIWIVDGKNDFYFKDGNLLRVSATEKFVPEYLKHLLEALISAYKSEMSSGTAYAALTISALKEMMVYDVPHAEQNQFAAFVKQVDKSKFEIKQSLEKLELLKKALMQKYFG